VLWLANPDLTLHGNPLGSPAHLEALRKTERCVLEVVRTVERLRSQGEEILLLIGSDHGQETVGDWIDVEAWLAAQGLATFLEAGDIAVAGQGTAALLYATDRGHAPLLSSLDDLRRQPWADGVVAGEALAEHGHAARGGVCAAVNMGRRDDRNPYGVRGQRWAVAEPGKATGNGQHGGWGAGEARPFLIVNAAGMAPGAIERATSLVDIAPTMLSFLALPTNGLDGAPVGQ
jgi:arylsulfatase A-like enzyme